MVLTQPVGEVLLVVFLHQALVIDEKDVGGHGDGGVAIVDRGGGVEEFEAFGALACLGWFFLKGIHRGSG